MTADLQKAAVIEMLERLGEAVSDGNLAGISTSYGYPALFLSDEQVVLLESAGQVEEVFAANRTWYLSKGIQTAKPELLRLDAISDKLVSVDVRWPGFDKDGKENYSETSHYLIHFDGAVPLIRAAASRTK